MSGKTDPAKKVTLQPKSAQDQPLGTLQCTIHYLAGFWRSCLCPLFGRGGFCSLGSGANSHVLRSQGAHRHM